ncbi:MAG: sugar ABC transporter permease, partial [Acidothermus sp.]|nr:sugar ABC transporter permease [Acidothermus sp.]
MDSRFLTALEVVIGVPAVLVIYIWGTERVIGILGERWKRRIRPWLWLLPAIGFLGFFLVYPTIQTIIRSFQGRNELHPRWVGLANYKWFFTSSSALGALLNNVLWIV